MSIFTDSLQKGKLIKRYKRFMADVELESGELVTAHCANSGSMMGLVDAGNVVWLSPANNPKRKLQWTLELIEVDGNKVGVNTFLANKIAINGIKNNMISQLTGYDTIKSEVKYGTNSRIDVLLQAKTKPDCYVEVKNVTLQREPGLLEFPDAVTTRGTKHLYELEDMVKQGNRALMLYLIQYEGAKAFKIASDIDSDYAKAFEFATKNGVEAYAYGCQFKEDDITLYEQVEILRG